jgi:hypothetical protein
MAQESPHKFVYLKMGKKRGRLTPATFSLLHATDLADRYERNIFPLVRGPWLTGTYILLVLGI